MRLPNLYDSLNLFDAVLARASALILRRPYDATHSNTRAGVYARAQERFDRIVQGGDLVNLAPVLPGDPLVNVKAEHHPELLALGADQHEGKFLMPRNLDDEDQWKFKQWFPRATVDLESKGVNWHLTVDGRPTNGYILPEDLRFGADPTSTSLLMAAFPVLFAAGYALYQVPVFGPLLAMAICGPLLALHAYALYQAEGAGTLAKVVALSGGVPLLAGGLLGSTNQLGQLSPRLLVIGGAVVGLMLMSSMAFKGATKSPLFSLFSQIKHVVLIVAAVAGLNAVLGLLPDALNWVKPIGLFAVACAYPLYYTLGNYKVRTAELELQSKQRAGSTQGTGSMLGKMAPVRMQQIRNAARDPSPLIHLGKAHGVLIKADLAVAPDAFQIMALSLNDLSTHLHVFGATGTGKTSSILRPLAMRLAVLPERIGMILSDGKGGMVADMRDMLDIVVEPGTKFAPFQGLGSEEITTSFAESHGESMDNKDSIWVMGAGTFHRFALAILEALVQHEKAGKGLAEKQLAFIEQQIEYHAAQKVLLERGKQDLFEVNAQLIALAGMTRSVQAKLRKERVYRWTPAAYARLKDILAVPVMAAGGVWKAHPKAMALFQELGYNPSGEKMAIDPDSIHPDLMDSGRVLARAIAYFHDTWPNTAEEQRSSFLINVNEDVLQFLKSDKLRGSRLLNGVEGVDEAWADTEEGVDITQVVYGKRLGVNLPATQYGTTGKLIVKLVKTRIFREIRLRAERHGDNWRKATGQTSVMDMVDECQDMVSKMEIDLTAVARSMGLFFVYATQSVESLNNAMPSDDAKLRYLNNFRSLVSFKSSPATYALIQARAGHVKKKKVPVSVQATIDYSRAIDTYYNTVYADPNHPSSAALRDLDRRGSTRMQVMVQGVQHYQGMSRKVPIDELKDQNWIPVFAGGEYVDGKVLEDTDLSAHLSVQGSAVMFLNRAGHDRIDFARTNYVPVEDVKPFLDKHAA